MEKCTKRKYKKPLLKECLKKNLNVNESMSIAELCSLLHSGEKKATKNKKKQQDIQSNKVKSKQDKHVNFIHDNFMEKKNVLNSKVHFINSNFSKTF